MTAHGKVEMYPRRGDGRWSWRHRAANGKIDATAGQGFATKSSAKRSAMRWNPGEAIVETSR